MKVKRASLAVLASIAVVATSCLEPPSAYAGMISTEQVATGNQTDLDRAKVQAFLERADVKQRLQAFGVKGLFAQQRVAALSGQEVHALAQKIDSLPAGGRVLSSLSDSDLVVILLIAILVAVVAA